MEGKISPWRALFDKHREIVLYLIFGGVTTSVNWVIYSITVMTLPFGTEMNILIAGAVAWVVAVSVAFITNKIWVFSSKSFDVELVFKEALAFFGGRTATGVLEIVGTPALFRLGLDATIFGVEALPAKIIVSVVIVILNYVLSKFFAFNMKQ